MPLPARLRAKLLARFDELIAEGEAIHHDIQEVRRDHGERVKPRYTTRKVIDWPRFVEWRTKCKSLLVVIIPAGHAHRGAAEDFSKLLNRKDRLEYGIALLKGIKADMEGGFLGDVSMQIEAEIAADYVGQAEQLLSEGQPGKYDHVPAAVLTGAVLEKALRTLCDKQTPPVPTMKPNGQPIMLNGLIEALKKAGVYNEMKAKQLRSWAAIRNHAAHGEFDDFNRSDVEQMIKGINAFLADYVR